MSEAATSVLESFPETGKPKGSRLASAQAVIGIYGTMHRDDLQSSYLRAGVQDMLDGKPPWNQAAMKASGAGFRHNLNFGKGKALLSQTLAGYNDMLENVQVLIAPQVPSTIGDPVARTEWQNVIADEWSKMARDWPQWEFQWQVLSNQFVTHGVGFGYFKDETCWTYEAAGWDKMKIPRGTEATEEKVDLLMAEKSYLPYELYKFIEDEKYAMDLGWDVDLVRKALVAATKYNGQRPPNQWGMDWAELQKRIKNNDASLTYENNCTVETVHSWVREFDGTYSHFISLVKPMGDGEGFLYSRESRYENAANFFTTFCYEVGNGTYHGIRGQGYQMFQHVQADNRMRCEILDAMTFTSKVLLQPKNAGQVDQSPFTMNGPVVMVSAQWDVIKHVFPNISQNILPIVHDFSLQLDANLPSMQSRAVNDDRQARTAYELKAEQGSDAALSLSAMAMFYRSWRRLLREMFRRTQKIIENDMLDDYPEVGDFLNACVNRGVPEEVILSITRVNEVRAVGMGSQSYRQRVYDDAMGMMSMFDEVGRKNLARSKLVTLLGTTDADAIMPADQKPRPVIDQTIALLENNLMFDGKEIPPLDGQNHFIHAQVHLQAIAASIQKLEDWRNNGEVGSIEDLQADVMFLSVILPHTEQHVEALGQDQTRAAEFAALRKGLQNYTAIWMTYMRQLLKAQKERQDQQQTNGNAVDPELIFKQQKHQQTLQQSSEKFALAQTMKVKDVENKMLLDRVKADEKNAQSIRQHALDQALDGALPGAGASQVLTNARFHT